jgi:predicted anti-sigma-YlaC factor YlaD
MHRLIRDHLEEVLTGDGMRPDHPAGKHLAACEECRNEVSLMQGHGELLRSWQSSAEVDPHPGFYARVMERIETQGPASIWNLFFDSVFGRRIAMASLALALLLGGYLVGSERMPVEDTLASGAPSGDAVLTVPDVNDSNRMIPAPMFTGAADTGAALASAPDQDSVLVNLVTYREQ